MPFTMDKGRPLDIRAGQHRRHHRSRERLRTALPVSEPRHAHQPDIFDPSTNGDSIARWEGETLVVDTIGFHADRGITTIPGGGYRTDTSHLVERYRLLKDGSVLSVTFTWTDPKVFRTPHTYEFRYNRLPANYEPRTVGAMRSV